jgi:hypothetical protein
LSFLRRHFPLVAAFVTGALALASATAAAAAPFPIEESFQNKAFGSANWRRGEAAELTAPKDGEGKGWLRLTPAEANKFGFVYYNEAFPSTNGVQAEFEYADWGGTGADGLTFFLFDGATSEKEFHAGQPGGALGYASCEGKPGLKSAYIGVGFDEYGNFTNLGGICGLDGKTQHANYVSVRGSEEEKYKLLEGASKETSESLKAERPQARRVSVSVTPEDKLSVYIRYPDGTQQTIVENLQLLIAKLPKTLKFGFVGSTGGSTDNHEIRKSRTAKPTELVASVSKTGGGHERGEELTWTAIVKNEGPNPTQSEAVTTSTGEQSLEGVSWTCTGTENALKEKAACVTASGSGLPTNVSAGAMPTGTSLEYHIKGRPTSETNYAQMTLETEPTGDTGEINPEKERATVKTNLTPLFNKGPSFTLAANGKATATAGTALGGEVKYTYHWQRCEPSGEGCVNIAGAEELTYTTTAADRGHTIRFTQTATNSAASTTAVTPSWPLPKTTITEAPAAHVATKTATLKFATETKEATLECKLDEGAWEACTSPKEYKGLSEGKHTFSARAVYGGLIDVNPPTAEWTVEATPPAKPTITPEGKSPSPNNHEKLTFGGLVAGGTLECKLDAGAFSVCTSPQEFTGLADGEHKVEARQKNKAGLESEIASYKWTVEATPPAKPTITPEGKSPSPNNHEKFTFGGLVAGDTIECKLDGGAFKVCSSPQEVTGLADGEHTIEARQKNKAGVNSEAASYKWTVEATPPAKPTITPEHSSPSPSNHEKFTFGGLVAGDTLECKLDSGEFKVCSSPQEVTGLADGEHTIEARQKNKASVNSEAASYKWTVEATPPAKPTITPEHSSPSPTSHESFTFGSLVPGGTLECKLEGGAFKVCTSPQEFTGLADGEHTIEARQKDKAGSESEAASYKWSVNTKAPHAPTIVSGPPSPSSQTNPTVKFGGLEEGARLECRIDGGEWRVCSPAAEFSGLQSGEHTVEARQVSNSGVVSGVASYKWTIEATKPPAATSVAGPAGSGGEFIAGSFAGRKAAATLALQCTKGGLVLIDVLISNNRVALFGAADKSLIGQTVAINLVSAHQQVATAVVGADGLFGTTAPLPPLSIRFTNKALYQATAAGRRSAALKLVRRMHVTSITVRSRRVLFSGRVSLPLAVPIAPIVFERRTSCHSSAIVAKVKPRADGAFKASLPVPPHAAAGVYQARTMVRGLAGSSATFPTFTLPRVVVVE